MGVGVLNSDEKKVTAVDACVGLYLTHSGTKGMHWRTHGDGKRWQSHAVYANGQPDPDSMVRGSKKPSAKEVKEFRDKLDQNYSKNKGEKTKEAFSEIVQDTMHDVPKAIAQGLKTTAIFTGLAIVCPPAAFVYLAVHNGRAISNTIKQAKYS